jgi:hypothetical protein
MELESSDTTDLVIEFQPALSLRARILGAELNGRKVPFQIETGTIDQHARVHVPVRGGSSKLLVHFTDDFGVSPPAQLPPLGGSSRGLRIVSESWTASRDDMTMELSGVAGNQYDLPVCGSNQIASIDGAEFVKSTGGGALVRIRFPAADTAAIEHRSIVFHFVSHTRR